MRNKKGQFIKGYKPDIEFRKQLSISHIGKVFSEEVKKKISDSNKKTFKAKYPKGRPVWNKGKPCSDKERERLLSYVKGKKLTLEHRKKCSDAHKARFANFTEEERKIEIEKRRIRFSGENNPNWNGGVSKDKNHKREYQKKNRERYRILCINYRTKKAGNGGSHTVKQWENLKAKYGYSCLCCKKVEPEIKLSADHIVPVSKGGSSDISNIQPLCISCNTRKMQKVVYYTGMVTFIK